MFSPDELLQLGLKLVGGLAALTAVVTTLATKTWPWLKAKRDSRSTARRIGAELFSASNIERSLRFYVQPLCQDLDPAGGEEPRLVYGVQQKLFDALDRALTHPTEYNFVFLLADSGMGKTSALLNYYVRHLRRWRKPFKLALIPLGIPDADERIAAVPDKGETVIFLDAFDEDTLAIVDHVERLRMLLKATRDFHRVLISCRTQFFSRDEEIPKETGKLKVGIRDAGEPAEYMFHKIYLSPFSDEQVAAYLRRRYPFWKYFRRRRARAMVEKVPHLTARPMLLAHINDLARANRPISYSFELYEEMINAWLERERGFIESKEDLLQFSKRLAVDLYLNRARRGSERIPRAELSTLAKQWRIPLDDWKLSGRSLLNRDAEGNFKFAHRSIMEYLFVVRALAGEHECLKEKWTDQMLSFLWEMLKQECMRGNLSSTLKEQGIYLAAGRPQRSGLDLLCDLLVSKTSLFKAINNEDELIDVAVFGHVLRFILSDAEEVELELVYYQFDYPGEIRGDLSLNTRRTVRPVLLLSESEENPTGHDERPLKLLPDAFVNVKKLVDLGEHPELKFYYAPEARLFRLEMPRSIIPYTPAKPLVVASGQELLGYFYIASYEHRPEMAEAVNEIQMKFCPHIERAEFIGISSSPYKE